MTWLWQSAQHFKQNKNLKQASNRPAFSFSCVTWRCCHLLSSYSFGDIWISAEYWWNDTDRGENGILRGNTVLVPIYPVKIPYVRNFCYLIFSDTAVLQIPPIKHHKIPAMNSRLSCYTRIVSLIILNHLILLTGPLVRASLTWYVTSCSLIEI